MFSDKERESWQNIKAPTSLLEKTKSCLESDAHPRKTNYKKMLMTLVAASFVLIFAIAFFMASDDVTTRIYVGGTKLTASAEGVSLPEGQTWRMRSIESSLSLTLEAEEETVISTSDGYFDVTEAGVTSHNSLTSFKVKGKTLINWIYPIPEDGEAVRLTVKTGKTEQTVEVVHDSETGLKNVTLIKK